MSGPRMLVVAGGTRTTASSRHRLWNYRPLLEVDGVALEWIEYGGGREPSRVRAAGLRAAFVRDLFRAGTGAEVVLLQKILVPSFVVRRWRRSGARIVYDFDDALFARAVTGEPERAWKRRRARFDAMLGEADVVIAGSPPLAEYARPRASRVEVLYPSLLRERFPPRPERPAGERVVLGWIGNDQSQIYLRALDPVLQDLFTRRPEARLRVCSSVPPALSPGVAGRLEFVPWTEEAELESARSFDVAVSPLGDEPWSRARGGRVSVLLSMASSVPVVASPGGGIEELVADDGGVVFADDPRAWAAALDRMVADGEARARVGREARSVIERRIWADVQYPQLRAILFGQ